MFDINKSYKELTDAEAILQAQFDEIFNQKEREAKRDEAEINYESTLAEVIKKSPTATGAKDAAKCDAKVKEFKIVLQEAQRMVDAGKRAYDWLENSHQWQKLVWKKLNNMGG